MQIFSSLSFCTESPLLTCETLLLLLPHRSAGLHRLSCYPMIEGPGEVTAMLHIQGMSHVTFCVSWLIQFTYFHFLDLLFTLARNSAEGVNANFLTP